MSYTSTRFRVATEDEGGFWQATIEADRRALKKYTRPFYVSARLDKNKRWRMYCQRGSGPKEFLGLYTGV